MYAKTRHDKARGKSILNPPINQEQFEIIDRIIHSLRNIFDSYLTVDLATPLNNMTYFQVRKDNENLWRVELHFEQPDIFSYKKGWKSIY